VSFTVSLLSTPPNTTGSPTSGLLLVSLYCSHHCPSLVLTFVLAYYFAFVGANIVAITYLLDSYPARAGPLLVIVCAMRGIMSFGVSYGIQPMIAAKGYDGAFGIFAALTAAFGLLGVPIFIWGKNIRAFTGRFAKDKGE
jgi:hypothetical protein